MIRSLDELKGERTMLMIVHRLTAVRNCGRLALLDKGTIEAIGIYDEVLAKSEGFRKMAGA